jgi:fibronectin type 3 domain-containing protein
MGLLLSPGLTGCQKTPDVSHSVEVSFTPPSPAPSYYEVFRSTQQDIYDGNHPYISHLEGTHFIDMNVRAGETYYYRIRSVREDSTGLYRSGLSQEAKAVVPQP